MSSIAVCDDCGGPAWWTIQGPFHDVFYICQGPCDGFLQLDLFLEAESWVAPGTISLQVDSSPSVSAFDSTLEVSDGSMDKNSPEGLPF